MKAIIIGHHEHSQGAYSDYFEMHEWAFFNSFVEELKQVGDIYYHNPKIHSYTQRMKATAEEINKKEYEMVLALHFNGSSNKQANGTETLYVSERGSKIGRNFNSYMVGMGLRNRGVKPLNNSSRGFAEIFYPKAPAVILEPFFGSNLKDCRKFDIDKFIEALECL